MTKPVSLKMEMTRRTVRCSLEEKIDRELKGTEREANERSTKLYHNILTIRIFFECCSLIQNVFKVQANFIKNMDVKNFKEQNRKKKPFFSNTILFLTEIVKRLRNHANCQKKMFY